jgi:hypothetical protein
VGPTACRQSVPAGSSPAQLASSSATLRKPIGPLRVQWRAGGVGPVGFLIDLAYTLHVLEHAVTRRSAVILRDKVKKLLRPPSLAQYDEILTELRVGRPE